MKHETVFKHRNIKRRKSLQHHANLSALEALKCSTGSIAEGTASCYMLLEPIHFSSELLLSRFFKHISIAR
jgi:hypothetical protein